MDKNKISLSQFEINQIIIEETKLVLQEKKTDRLDEGVFSTLAGYATTAGVGAATGAATAAIVFLKANKFSDGIREIQRLLIARKANSAAKRVGLIEDQLQRGEYAAILESLIKSFDEAGEGTDPILVKLYRKQIEILNSAMFLRLREDLAAKATDQYSKFKKDFEDYCRLLAKSPLADVQRKEAVAYWVKAVKKLTKGTDLDGKDYKELVELLENGSLGEKALAQKMSNPKVVTQNETMAEFLEVELSEDAVWTLKITRRVVLALTCFAAVLGTAAVAYWRWTPDEDGDGGTLSAHPGKPPGSTRPVPTSGKVAPPTRVAPPTSF